MDWTWSESRPVVATIRQTGCMTNSEEEEVFNPFDPQADDPVATVWPT
jgi:hypothetical protein